MKQGTIKEGYKLTITDAEGIVMDEIELSGYNLGKSPAKVMLVADIIQALPQEAFEESNEEAKAHTAPNLS